MKQLIVLCASILLGLYIADMIIGSDESSIISSVKKLWITEIRIRTEEDVIP